MENYLAFSEKITTELSENFKELTFYSKIENIGVNISVFFIHGLSEQIKKDNAWRKISEEVALSYQSKIVTLEDKWNIYLVYVFFNDAPKELKSIIENDKFSSRKIVEENINEALTEEIINGIIRKHITHSDLIDLVDDTLTKLDEIYDPNDSIIWDIIDKEKLVSGNLKLQENLIEQLKSCCNEN